MTAFHPGVMPAAQQETLRAMGSTATERGFYLAGGTALAIQLGHRRSVDLEWFTTEDLTDPMRFAAELRRSGIPFEILDLARGTLRGTSNGVRVSFLEYHYPELGGRVEWRAYQCHLAGLEDLACMKLSGIGGRGLKKDFIDIYSLGREHYSLGEMLASYQRKYETRDIGHLLYALTFFDDAEEEEMPDLLRDVTWTEVKQTIEGWVRDYVQDEAP